MMKDKNEPDKHHHPANQHKLQDTRHHCNNSSWSPHSTGTSLGCLLGSSHIRVQVCRDWRDRSPVCRTVGPCSPRDRYRRASPRWGCMCPRYNRGWGSRPFYWGFRTVRPGNRPGTYIGNSEVKKQVVSFRFMWNSVEFS